MMPSLTQRWRSGWPRWRPASEGGFDAGKYSVRSIDERSAAAFVGRHHYASTFPSARYRYGLVDQTNHLVGVIVLGIPMSRAVLTNPFPNLEPYSESLELSRLVLLDMVPANAESWFCARVFADAAQRGVRGVVAFADPEPRWRLCGGKRHQIKVGHLGVVYQALNFDYLGRATRRSLVILPDGSVLPARSIAKLTGGESGRAGVVNRLTALGADPPRVGQEAGEWLRAALHAIGATHQAHPGNHRYAIRLGRTRGERTRVAIGMASRPYPKWHSAAGQVG